MHPILFEIGPLSIKSYGLLLALSFILGTYLSVERAKKVGINTDRILDLVLIILITSVAGARLMFVIIYWGQYAQNPLHIFKIWEGGLVLYGGIIAAVTASFIYFHIAKLSAFKIFDILAPGLALGIFITRIGCFLNGCCFGLSCSADFPLGVTFPEGSPAYYVGLMGSVHPTQLYASLGGLLLFLFFLYIERFKKFDGFLFCLFFILYPVIRFIIEMFRYHDDIVTYEGVRILTVSQIVSICLFVFGIGMYIYLSFKHSNKNEATT